ncbi:MAG: tryptophan transporter [Bacillaceae bacterium]|nr:tryptophan transporter [Bacillaceae bacterium]
MNIRILAVLSLLVGIGAVLHAVVPPLLFGMKPDMLLSMMFLGILLFPKVPYVLLLSLVTGFISALTTGFPGGQIANMIDKPVTAFSFLALYLLFHKGIKSQYLAPILTAVGTMISGAVFLYVGLFIIGLAEGSFTALFVGIVLPAAAMNTVLILIVYPVVQAILKRSPIITQS